MHYSVCRRVGALHAGRPWSAVRRWRRKRSSAVEDRPSASLYNVEAALCFWSAEPTLIVSSESLGIPGDDIDLTSDLGIEKKRLTELRVVLRPAHRSTSFAFTTCPSSTK